ncbi:histidine kinase [Flavivirga aquatica]|uniref:histidine kinase n=1 Tax=Flavivirga aquatica TaxID=1849968 RepID=A0A1E5T8W7_9FLAO|nr:ATP-binding protein [Flavivirga aquatica]OEK07747.1 histidine kinase [Flavivirga aquatica]
MQREGQAILVAVFTLVFLCIILIILFVIFQKRKNALLLEQKVNEQHFEQEISKMQIEIREETFRNISWELHDNIGQLITLAKIQLQSGASIEDIKESLDKSLKEVRTLSRAINPEALKNTSLTKAIQQELDRFNRLQYIEAELIITGKEKIINHEVEVVFFRILQEFFSNTIKHANASHLKIMINFDKNEVNIIAEDNGKGFNIKNNPEDSGIGLLNIEKRAQLIGAKINIESAINEGTKLYLSYPYTKDISK